MRTAFMVVAIMAIVGWCIPAEKSTANEPVGFILVTIGETLDW